jgi:hypothetical protein
MRKAEAAQAQPAIDPALVKDGFPVRRRPAGRCCTVAQVSPDRQKVLVNDAGKRFWVGMDSLVDNWY